MAGTTDTSVTLMKLLADNAMNLQICANAYDEGYSEGYHDALIDAMKALHIQTDEEYFNN